MIQDELIYQIETHFGHLPTPEQHAALQTFATFMTDRDEQVVMVLRGSAGTGKTTLASAIVRGMLAMKQKLVLMAPTGRAAKVFSNYSGTPAYTIHRRIYRQKTAADLSAFSLGFNAAQDTLFIVDEASMIANADTPLLDDLIRFVYNYKNCRLLLIGDRAQLPPVGEEESPALMAHVLRGYGMKVYEADLTEVLRQAEDSGILWNATEVRCMMADGRCELPKIRLDGFPDIVSVPGDELIESLASSFSHVGMDETLVVTRSNKRANIYNQGIRNTVLDREDELCRGDRIMIVKNNYYWVKSEGIEGNISFIANGDIAVVQRVRNVHELYGFRFAEVTMTFPDYDDYELTAITLLDTLTTEASALTREQQEQLYTQVMEDYMDVPYKSKRIKKLKDDKYYNALQIKFAYAATCHKAQGGQWAHVYIDQGYMTDDMLTPDYFHWLCTALACASEQVFVVDWPKTQVANASDGD